MRTNHKHLPVLNHSHPHTQRQADDYRNFINRMHDRVKRAASLKQEVIHVNT